MQFYVNDPTKTFCIGIKNITNWINLHDIFADCSIREYFFDSTINITLPSSLLENSVVIHQWWHIVLFRTKINHICMVRCRLLY